MIHNSPMPDFSTLWSSIDSSKERFSTLSVTGPTLLSGVSGSTVERATELRFVSVFFDPDHSNQISDASGLVLYMSPDGTNWTQVTRWGSTNGYPKFGSICAVIQPGMYYRYHWWGAGRGSASNAQAYRMYYELDNLYSV